MQEPLRCCGKISKLGAGFEHFLPILHVLHDPVVYARAADFSKLGAASAASGTLLAVLQMFDDPLCITGAAKEP